MSRIQIPFSAPVKRITLDVDEAGNMQIKAVDLRNSDFSVQVANRIPRPLSAIEALYWISKACTEVLGQMVHSRPAIVGGDGGSSDDSKEGN